MTFRHSAFCARTDQLVPTLPKLAVEAIVDPFMNQIATLPVPSKSPVSAMVHVKECPCLGRDSGSFSRYRW